VVVVAEAAGAAAAEAVASTAARALRLPEGLWAAAVAARAGAAEAAAAGVGVVVGGDAPGPVLGGGPGERTRCPTVVLPAASGVLTEFFFFLQHDSRASRQLALSRARIQHFIYKI